MPQPSATKLSAQGCNSSARRSPRRQTVQSLLRLTFTLACAGMMAGCAQFPTRLEPPPIPANLRQPCAVPAPPSDGSRATARRWAVEISLAMRECADRHAELVRAVGGEDRGQNSAFRALGAAGAQLPP